MSANQQMLLGTGKGEVVGQIAYTTLGTYSWTVPAGVTSVSAVAVGKGSYAGGALSYSNDIPVTPGEVLSIAVSTDALLYRGGTTLLLAKGATEQVGGKASEGIGQVRNSGGDNGGAGAAGYGGNGGAGPVSGLDGTAGQGGGGGGGGRTNEYSQGTGGGGGVGLYGIGASGAAGTYGVGGGGGSGGANGGDGIYVYEANGVGGHGGNYGGGRGNGENSSWSTPKPGQGAVRIIWPGNLRQFPSTRAADE